MNFLRIKKRPEAFMYNRALIFSGVMIIYRKTTLPESIS